MIGVIDDQARGLQNSLSSKGDLAFNFSNLAWNVKNQGFFRTELAQGIGAADG